MTDPWDRLAPGCRQSAADGGEVLVKESANDGQAAIRFIAPPGWRLERLAIHHRHKFDWLALRKAADAIVMACRPDGVWEAHIIECKSGLGIGTWRKVREQLGGSRLRLDAICGVLGLGVERVVLYTAFREDKIGSASADLALVDTLAGPVGTAERRIRDEMRALQEWQAGRVSIPGFGRFTHHRNPLDVRDGCGYATVSLSSAA